METEAVGADPGVFDIVVTVVEHLAVELFVGIVAGLFAHAVELGLLQQLRETIGLLLFLLLFLLYLLQLLLLVFGWTLLLLLKGNNFCYAIVKYSV